ncbi:MAG: hypothetical protein J6L62_04495 [Clostridia bacterium]|nr:hypothetical protein [Clostridia bacterium]
MNKNILIRAVSLILVAGILLTFFGCKKGGDEQTPTTADTNATGELAVPSAENGTFKVDVTVYPEKVDGTTSSGATSKVTEKTGELYYITIQKPLDSASENMKRHIKENADALGIDKAKAESILKSGTTWKHVSIFVYVLNSKSKDAAMKYVESKQNDSLIIDTELDTEYGIPAGRGNHIALDAYIDTSKYETEEDIIEVLKTMDIKIVYTLMDDSSDSVDDWSKVTTAYMPVGF